MEHFCFFGLANRLNGNFCRQFTDSKAHLLSVLTTYATNYEKQIVAYAVDIKVRMNLATI